MYPYHRERHNPNQWNYTNGTTPPPYVKPVKAVKGIIRQIFYEAFHMFQIISHWKEDIRHCDRQDSNLPMPLVTNFHTIYWEYKNLGLGIFK
jgi:hypothetical protein